MPFSLINNSSFQSCYTIYLNINTLWFSDVLKHNELKYKMKMLDKRKYYWEKLSCYFCLKYWLNYTFGRINFDILVATLRLLKNWQRQILFYFFHLFIVISTLKNKKQKTILFWVIRKSLSMPLLSLLNEDGEELPVHLEDIEENEVFQGKPF